MRSFTIPKPAAAMFAGLTLVGALAGCTAPAPAPAATNTSDGGADTDTTTGGTSTTAPEPATAAPFADGSYTQSADYEAPSGTETVDVTLTLADGVVTAVTVAGHASDPQAKRYQSQFSEGISAIVVGKNISELAVDKVGGSSLTSGGFNAAVESIKADAAA